MKKIRIEAKVLVKRFGKHLKKIRIAKGKTQEDLAYESDLTFSQIGRIERGITNTGILNAFLLAKALDMHPRELFDFDIEEENSSTTPDE